MTCIHSMKINTLNRDGYGDIALQCFGSKFNQAVSLLKFIQVTCNFYFVKDDDGYIALVPSLIKPFHCLSLYSLHI